MAQEKFLKDLEELAKDAGCSGLWKQFEEKAGKIRNGSRKLIAVTGGDNSGKSTLINMLMKKDIAPVSMLPSEEKEPVLIQGEENDWLELPYEVYLEKDNLYSVLWDVDSVIYLVTGVAPVSAEDLKALQICISHGIPVTAAVGKMDLVEEQEREEVLEYIKDNLAQIGSAPDIIVLDDQDKDKLREDLLEKTSTDGEDREVKIFLMGIYLLKMIEECLAEQGRKLSEKEKEDIKEQEKQKDEQEKELLEWSRIQTELKERQLELTKQAMEQVKKAGEQAAEKLAESMKRASSKKEWWYRRFPAELERHNRLYADEINGYLCRTIENDRKWIIDEAEKKFSIKLSLTDEHGEAEFTNPEVEDNEVSEKFGKRKKLAIGAFAVSTAGVAGSILFAPVSLAVGGIMASVGGKFLGAAAVLGTGAWALTENINEKEQLETLTKEIENHVSECYQQNAQAVKEMINYIYESMLLEIKQNQIALANDEEPGSKELVKRRRELNSLIKRCEELLGHYVSE